MPKPAPVLKEDGIDFKRLDAAVQNAVESEARYWRENDAKFRAVNQKVATYEEFEGIVMGSHIKPMTEDIAALDLKRSNWMDSGRVRARDRRRELEGTMREDNATQAATAAPRSVQQFLRDWRNACRDDAARLAYLELLGAPGLAALFKDEIGHGLLGQFVVVLDATFAAERCATAAAMLEAMAGTGRFALTVEFMTDKEHKAAASLLGKMTAAAGEAALSEELLLRLKKLYLV